MGLDGADLVDDGHGFGASDGVDGGGKEGKLSAVVVVVSCSICLDAVTDDGDRSWAKLQCGHQFHLDCIGSAFNIKGAMQCPNCRKIEKGQWLYAMGCRALPELTMDDISTEEDLYDLSYSEMSFGVHWCPFSGLARLPSLFDEGDFSSTTYHDFLGQRTIFAEHTAATSTAAHPCPYIAYLGPVHPSSSTSNATISDVSNFNGLWNGASSVPNDISASYAFPGVEVHMNAWDHHSQLFPTSNAHIGGGGGEQTSVPSVSQRARVSTSDIPRQGSFMQQPFVVRHGSSARSGSSVPTTMVPPYPGSVARARDRVQALQAYFQQPSSNSPSAVRTPVISGSRRSSSHDQTNGFYFFPSSSSSGRAFQEAENPLSNRFPPHNWDNREHHFPSYQSSQLDRDSSSSGWGLFHHPGAGSEAAAAAAGVRFRQRHGSERMPSQNRP